MNGVLHFQVKRKNESIAITAAKGIETERANLRN